MSDDVLGVGAIFGEECQKRGMLVRVAGDAIMMSPTLIMTPGEVDEVRPILVVRCTSPSPFRQSIAILIFIYPRPTCSSAGGHLWRSPEGHRSEGCGAEVAQEEIANAPPPFDEHCRWCTDEN
jgi:hypothetical protein